MITSEIKNKFKRALDVVYREAREFNGLDLREVVRHYEDFVNFCRAYDYANKVVTVYGNELSEDELENYIGTTHNAESTFSHIYGEFVTKFTKTGNNTYHTDEENYKTAIRFAKMIKLFYSVDLIVYMQVTEKDSAIESYKAHSRNNMEEHDAFSSFLTLEELRQYGYIE